MDQEPNTNPLFSFFFFSILRIFKALGNLQMRQRDLIIIFLGKTNIEAKHIDLYAHNGVFVESSALDKPKESDGILNPFILF